MSCAQELRSKELRSRTFVKRSQERGRTMLMGARSYALYHARAKMSIGATKKIFLFFYIYTYVNYTTLSHFCQQNAKIKKKEKRLPFGNLSSNENLFHTESDALLIQPLQLPLRHEQLLQQPQLLRVLLPFQLFLHTLPRTLLLHLRD